MQENEIIYKVSEINTEIKNALSGLNNIWVEGEVSGFKQSQQNHLYFDLKDENSIISCVFFKWYAKNTDFEIKNGLLVKVFGDVTIYDKQSKYQLNIKKIIPLKIGQLQIEFEKLKKKLMAEGLFDEKRKKQIPKFPKTVGVITSLYGAAVRDIISIIKRRAPHINIMIYPVKVQGEGAKKEISDAIKEINEKFKEIDVLLVGRGGGSMEDLWAFNEEIVARAIAQSKIPIISCVGHQTDFTIADFVADLRAPTPSAAAEIVAQNVFDVINHIKQLEKRLLLTLKIIYQRIYIKCTRFINSRFYKNPYTLIEKHVLYLDNFYTEMIENIDKKLERYSNLLQNLNARIKNLDPKLPSKKGYVISKKGNSIIKSISQIKEGDSIEIVYIDGNASTLVKEITK